MLEPLRAAHGPDRMSDYASMLVYSNIPPDGRAPGSVGVTSSPPRSLVRPDLSRL